MPGELLVEAAVGVAALASAPSRGLYVDIPLTLEFFNVIQTLKADLAGKRIDKFSERLTPCRRKKTHI